MLTKVIGLLLGEMCCRLLELLSLSFSILCLLICFSPSADRELLHDAFFWALHSFLQCIRVPENYASVKLSGCGDF